MKNLLLIIAISLAINTQAQKASTKISKKAQQLYSKALDIAQEGNFPEGIKLLEQAISNSPTYRDAYLSLAGMNGELKNYDQAILNYDKARHIDSAYFRDYNLPYSINLAGKGLFKEALKAINQFLSSFELNESSRRAAEYRKRNYEFAIRYAEEHPAADYKFEPRNMGDAINSEVSEYYPTLTIDGTEFIYTRRVNNFNEDFYGSALKDGQWTPSLGLAGNINTRLNEGAQNISQDGQWLIFTGCNFPDGYGSCDLYISYYTGNGWTTPENMGSLINTEAWESAPSLSPDKKHLYFASRRYEGGYGGSDIYVSSRLPDGKWGRPRNLGPTVNTPGDETCPFIHADNTSLYFTSNGHPGYGGFDLFLSRKGPKDIWSNPENLGYPINTIEDEGSLVITADGATAYFASDRGDTRGGLDLYTFELRKDIRPIKTFWVKGKVYDKKTLAGLPSSVELTDLFTKQVISKIETDKTGAYLITLPMGKDYAFNVNKKGYLFFSENFPLSQKTPDSTYSIDIPLQPLEKDAVMVLKNVFFDINQSTIKPESQVELNNIVRLMKENPGLKISIQGHTDNTGVASENIRLSKERAGSVTDYLISQGIAASRLTSQGYGAEIPLADNLTEAGRAMNRRTEMKIISQ